jgi:CRP-like cAMP-binding protein
MDSPTPDRAADQTPDQAADQVTTQAILRGTWFGASLDEATADRLAGFARRSMAAAGEILFVEGSRSDEFGVLVSGRLALRMLVPERGLVTILTVEPGDLYGWSAIVPPNRATSTVVAVEASEMIAFDGMALRLALADDPILAAAFYPRVLQTVSRRLSATRLQLLDLFAHRETDPW